VSKTWEAEFMAKCNVEKARITWWGCGVQEQGDVRFMACSKYAEES
jgi:hypothetical protein